MNRYGVTFFDFDRDKGEDPDSVAEIGCVGDDFTLAAALRLLSGCDMSGCDDEDGSELPTA